ncbi:MAG: tRNA (N6-threonylcarbamoyladenosine(37)-N6)-methyltransferase TrmO [Eubacteriaceae bacterium]
MELKQIGIIHSPYKESSQAPPQGRMKDELFEIELFDEYLEGLKDVEKVSHLIVLYWCDKAERDVLTVVTPWEDKPHGVFATRSPRRPNPIAFDIVDLVKIDKNKLLVKKMDALDGSPLLDIKPYSEKIDCITGTKGIRD